MRMTSISGGTMQGSSVEAVEMLKRYVACAVCKNLDVGVDIPDK